MDMPAVLAEYFPEINIERVSEVIDEYGPVMSILQHTWSHETLQEIVQGKVSVPDEMINEAIAAKLSEDKNVTEAKFKSKKNGKLDVYIKTKSLGRVEFSGTIEKFVCNQDEAYVTYRMKERALKDHGLASWFLSRMSLSMAQNIFGKIDLGEDLPTEIKGNYVTLDCKEILQKSDLAQAEIKGHRVLDMVEIKSATPCDGYIMFETGLNIPEDIMRAALDFFLKR